MIVLPSSIFCVCVTCQVCWLTACTAVIGYVHEGPGKRQLVNKVLRQCFALLSSAISAVINYHNTENRPISGICVANHTSPIDVLILMCDTTYSLVSNRKFVFYSFSIKINFK